MAMLRSSKRQARAERFWGSAIQGKCRSISTAIVRALPRTAAPRFDLVNFDQFVMEHAYGVLRESIAQIANQGARPRTRLAGEFGKSLRAAKEKLEAWRRRYEQLDEMSPEQQELGERLKIDFQKRVEEAWREHSAGYLAGNHATQQAAVDAIKEAAASSANSAKRLVETQTTRYFNQARREIFDSSTDVTHYLYIAIRDAATTKWCKTRSGLVYKKGDPLLDAETPPNHWYCRSDIWPLTPHNPMHARLINDPNRARRNNRPEPLPAGWTHKS